MDEISQQTAAVRDKIHSLDDLASRLEQQRQAGKTIVHCHGVFDLLHPGHIRHFAAAKRKGDVLVVTLTPDRFVNKGPGRPVFTEALRAEALAALEIIDFVAINEWPTAVEVIQKLRPDYYVKGSDYKNAEDDLTGKISEEAAAVAAVGGKVHFTEEITFSSSKLINDHFPVHDEATEQHLQNFRQRFSAGDIIDRLQSLKGLKVAVVGDAIIDEYHSCKALGMASKSATINARFLGAESYAGGALAVANHLAGLCGSVHLITCLGAQDSNQSFIESALKQNVSAQFFTRPDGPTTVKRRFVDPFQYQKMFEVTFLEDTPLPAEVETALQSHLAEQLRGFDLVVVADFGHGMISQPLAATIASQSPYLALTVQTNSANRGYNPITKYLHADYLCIDQEEMRFAYHDRFGSLDVIMKQAADELSTQILSVTRGAQGSTTYKMDEEFIETPVFCKEVIDTIGAGDAYLSFTAPCAAAGFEPELLGFVGNTAGALASRIVGNKEPVDPVQLYKFIDTLLK